MGSPWHKVNLGWLLTGLSKMSQSACIHPTIYEMIGGNCHFFSQMLDVCHIQHMRSRVLVKPKNPTQDKSSQ